MSPTRIIKVKTDVKGSPRNSSVVPMIQSS
jgi:hypothetical protein